MPVYLLQQAEVRKEFIEDIEQKKLQLERELETCEIPDKTVVNKLKKYLMEIDVWHISEMDYPMKMQYKKWLQNRGMSTNSITKYLNAYDKIKQFEIAEQMQTLAGKQKYGWRYRNEVLYLRYHSDSKIVQEFRAARQEKILVWDFSRKCSENLKRQIYSALNRIIEVVPNLRVRKNKLLALKRFYDFCAVEKVTDVGLLELKHLDLLQELSKSWGAQAEVYQMGIVSFCRKNAFVEDDKIRWDATVWYLERFHFTKDRINASNPIESISFMEIKKKENRDILQAYMKYEFGVTGQAISTIVRRFKAIRNFLEFWKTGMYRSRNVQYQR